MITIKPSARARSIRITVHPDGRIVVTKPERISEQKLSDFVLKHQDWIEKQQRRFSKLPPQIALPKPRKGSKAYKEAREVARAIALERLMHFNQTYGFPYGTISIRNQKTRWGSCSSKGNLSFNYRIAFLPQPLADYLIVHELAHVKEHNHSKKFWDQVARTIPNHTVLRKELRTRYSL